MSHRMLNIAVSVALALLLLGAFSVAQPMFAQDQGQPGPPSGNGVQPVWVFDNPTCADLAAQFAPGATWNELRIEGSFDPGKYPDVWGEPGDLVVTIDACDGTYFSWSSNVGLDAVFVKAANNGNLYQYDPTGSKQRKEATSDTDLHPPINPNTSRPYEISHISFCYDAGAGKGGSSRDDKPEPVIIKRSEPSETLPGEEVTFTLEATNQGRESAVGVVVTDEVSEYLEILEVTTTQGTVTVEGQTIRVDVGVIGPDFVVVIVIRARVRDDAPSPLELENVARLNSHNGGERFSPPVTVTVSGMLPVTGGQPASWLVNVLLGLLVTLALLDGLISAGIRMSKRGVV